jgi:hypothetical protein
MPRIRAAKNRRARLDLAVGRVRWAGRGRADGRDPVVAARRGADPPRGDAFAALADGRARVGAARVAMVERLTGCHIGNTRHTPIKPHVAAPRSVDARFRRTPWRVDRCGDSQTPRREGSLWGTFAGHPNAPPARDVETEGGRPMADLPAWLLEQIAADEEAQRSPDGQWHAAGCAASKATSASCTCGVPQRVLDICAAYRRLVEWALYAAEDGAPAKMTDRQYVRSDALDNVVRILAVPYADRAGYRKGWQPLGLGQTESEKKRK